KLFSYIFFPLVVLLAGNISARNMAKEWNSLSEKFSTYSYFPNHSTYLQENLQEEQEPSDIDFGSGYNTGFNLNRNLVFSLFQSITDLVFFSPISILVFNLIDLPPPLFS